MFSELSRVIDQISRDKGIDKELLVEGLEEAVMQAAKKKFGLRRDMEVVFNEELGEIELFQFRSVVEKVEDDHTEISFEEATGLDPEVELGDDIGSKMDDVADLGRIAAQSAKQVIIQKMKEAEGDVIYEIKHLMKPYERKKFKEEGLKAFAEYYEVQLDGEQNFRTRIKRQKS